jgi:hypothetical protein
MSRFVTVCVSKGKPRLSTHHLAEDAGCVYDAMAAVFREFRLSFINQEPVEWTTKMVAMYVKELKARGFEVEVRDPRVLRLVG